VTRTGILTTRFDEALVYALAAHDTQTRKSTTVPYAAHLLGVASIVLEAGGTETEAIAALLHDVVEDQGGSTRRDDVEAAFGPEVASIVQQCSAEDRPDDPGWRAGKARYVAGVADMSPSALLVSLADKLYNARAILDDYRAIGDAVWARFGADEPEDANVLWYYGALIDAYADRAGAIPPRLLAELSRTVRQLTRLNRRPCCPRCGAGDISLIAHGMPSPEPIDSADDEGISLGGCCVPENPPDFTCELCAHSWSDQERSRR
jgi:hypothetical protein